VEIFYLMQICMLIPNMVRIADDFY
jgi:hypothetical protein